MSMASLCSVDLPPVMLANICAVRGPQPREVSDGSWTAMPKTERTVKEPLTFISLIYWHSTRITDAGMARGSP